MDKKLFAVSATVQKNSGEESKSGDVFTLTMWTVDMINTASYIEATSREEAIGITFERMYKSYPLDDGWYNHGIVVAEIPQEVIDRHVNTSS